uniref:Small vasohibin-binding protein n=1 Tax=Neogobius melanostomus TaxID=47308 RepID=A0A8C6TEW8_9GOBI
MFEKQRNYFALTTFQVGFVYEERPADSDWKRLVLLTFHKNYFYTAFLLYSSIYFDIDSFGMEPACRKDKPKLNTTPTRGDRARQKSAQQELKQRQRAEIYALNKVMTELEQQQFEAFCKQMQSQGE